MYIGKHNLQHRAGSHQRDREKQREGNIFLLKYGKLMKNNDFIACGRFGCHSSYQRKPSNDLIAALNQNSSDSGKNGSASSAEIKTDPDMYPEDIFESQACFLSEK